MSPAKQVRKILEVFLARVCLSVVPRLPRRAVLTLAKGFGSLAFHLARHLRQVGLANLEIAYGESMSLRDKRSVLRQSFRTFTLAMLDMLWFSRDTRARAEKHILIDPAFKELAVRKARVCVTAHLGNWELMGLAMGLIEVPLVSVASPLANPEVDGLFTGIRELAGQKILPKKGAVRALMTALREQNNIGILLDQNTKPSNGGIFVDFFGLPVPVSAAGASLALRTRAEVIFGFCVPLDNGDYRAFIRTRAFPKREEGESMAGAVSRVTQEIAAVIEDQVRENPGAWLWMYKRWKYVGPGLPRARYPFYSKVLPVY